MRLLVDCDSQIDLSSQVLPVPTSQRVGGQAGIYTILSKCNLYNCMHACRFSKTIIVRGTSCSKGLHTYAGNVAPDQPAHPCNLIWVPQCPLKIYFQNSAHMAEYPSFATHDILNLQRHSCAVLVLFIGQRSKLSQAERDMLSVIRNQVACLPRKKNA